MADLKRNWLSLKKNTFLLDNLTCNLVATQQITIVINGENLNNSNYNNIF